MSHAHPWCRPLCPKSSPNFAQHNFCLWPPLARCPIRADAPEVPPKSARGWMGPFGVGPFHTHSQYLRMELILSGHFQNGLTKKSINFLRFYNVGFINIPFNGNLHFFSKNPLIFCSWTQRMFNNTRLAHLPFCFPAYGQEEMPFSICIAHGYHIAHMCLFLPSGHCHWIEDGTKSKKRHISWMKLHA